MTNEEAIIDIRENIQPIVGGKSLDIAISSIENQIPKKPSETDKARCIHCGCVVKRDERFCKNCGQALDWSDTE